MEQAKRQNLTYNGVIVVDIKFKDRSFYCKQIKTPKECAIEPVCLWMPPQSFYNLEGPTIKSVTYIPHQIYKPKDVKEWHQAWHNKSHLPSDIKHVLSTQNEQEYRSNLRIRTVNNLFIAVSINDNPYTKYFPDHENPLSAHKRHFGKTFPTIYIDNCMFDEKPIQCRQL